MTATVNSGSTYVISNVKSGTVIDLSAGDNRTVTGWGTNHGNNQQWTLNWTGTGWTFRSVSAGSYLGISGTPADGLAVEAVTTAFEWDIWRATDPNTFRIYVPNTVQNLDLYGNGLPNWGTPITLWSAWDGLHQTWNFTQA